MKAKIQINKQSFKQVILIILFLLSYCQVHAQIYVNREWQSNNGNPLALQFSSSIISSINNELITVGNTSTTSQGANILITRYTEDGNIIWSNEFNTSNAKNDYGTSVTEDAQGDIYVCGTTDNNGLTNADIIVLKYKDDGTLIWSTTYNIQRNRRNALHVKRPE